MRNLIALFVLAFHLCAAAGNGTGKVGKILVGLQGTRIFIELLDPIVLNWPCSSVRADGFRYEFILTQGASKEMLAATLAAQASGKSVQFVGTGTCTSDTMEELQYVVVIP